MTQGTIESGQRPACQAANPGQCSNCSMAYDCARQRSGRTYSWAAVALVVVGVLVLFARSATGT